MSLNRNIIVSFLAATIAAQSFSDCNPLKGCKQPNPGSKQNVITTSFTGQSSLPDGWKKHMSAGNLEFGPDGAGLVLAKQGDSPGIDSDFYILFGSVEAKVKAAVGKGMISSIVTMSDTRDEFDWEFTGVNSSQAQSNYYGKGGDGTFDRGGFHSASQIYDTWHTYKIDWTPEAVTWSIDGQFVRTVKATEARGGGYPQTPSKVMFSLWAGGDPSMPEGTRDWAGGYADYSTPRKMWIDSVKIVNYSPADSYTYTDSSGNLQSIVVNGGTLMSNKNGAVVGNVDSSSTQSTTRSSSLMATTALTSVTSTKSPANTSISKSSNTTIPTQTPATTSTPPAAKPTGAGNTLSLSLTTTFGGLLAAIFVVSTIL